MSFKKIKTDGLIFLAKSLAKLPVPVIINIGAFLGYLSWLIPNKRKKIAARNIELCFPELTTKEQKKLLKKNLISTGKGFVELIITYWTKPKNFIHRFEINGIETVKKALENKHGCLLLTCHMHSNELAAHAINLTLEQPAFILSRQHNNKILEQHVDKARRNNCEKTIDKKDIRSVLKAFKNNRCIFYTPDQNFSYNCEFIDFFNLPAATITAPVKIAHASKAKVVPWFCFRQGNKWKISFLEPLDSYQTDEIKVSLKKTNQLFEQQIRKHPEQYLWVHRRFKNHPKGKNYLYSKSR